MDGYFDAGAVVDEDGWTVWIAPVRSHANLCCDCGLVYEVEFAAIGAENRDVRTASVGFRMRKLDGNVVRQAG
jgi:hypothetical protein